MTDIDARKCTVLATVADHSMVLASFPMSTPENMEMTREVWQFAQADWEGLKNSLQTHDWSAVKTLDAHQGAALLTSTILDAAADWIHPKTSKRRSLRTLGWMTKCPSWWPGSKQKQGTDEATDARDKCIAGILEEYRKYINRERVALQQMQRGSKGWWAKVRRLLQNKAVDLKRTSFEGCYRHVAAGCER